MRNGKYSDTYNRLLQKTSSGEDELLDIKILYGEDIKEAPIPDNGINSQDNRLGVYPIIEFVDAKGHRFYIDQQMMSKHFLLFGGIGSGKSNVFYFIIDALLENISKNDVFIIFDTKGDFKDRFFDSWDMNHVLIGNDLKDRQDSLSWNIYDELRDSNGKFSKQSEIIAKEISKSLFKGRESDTQPFFALAAADLVSKVLISNIRKARRTGDESSLTTEEFVRFLKSAGIQEYYDLTVNKENPDFASAQLYFGRPSDRLSPQALGVFGYINAMVDDLFVGVFAEKSPNGSFSMKRLISEKGGKVIFIEYDLSVGEVLGPMYRLLIDLALKEALGGRTDNRGNVFLIADEFKLLGDLSHIDDALNFGRSLGVKVFAGLQSINQLYDVYGESKGKVLAAGFMNSICFQTWDLDSRTFISERFGKKYENIHYRVNSNPIDVQREGYVVEDWDIPNLNIGQAYINLNGKKPFVFQFQEYKDK